MNFIRSFGHATQKHSDSTTGFEHLITLWPIALLVYFGLNAIVIFFTYRTNKKAMIHRLLALNLVLGVASYSLAPIVSIMALALGITAALLITLSLLAGK